MSTWKYSVNVTTLSGSHQHVYINIYLFIISCLNESQFLVVDPKNIKEKKIEIRLSHLLQTSLPPTIMPTSDLVSRENHVIPPFEWEFDLLSSGDHHQLHEHKEWCPKDQIILGSKGPINLRSKTSFKKWPCLLSQDWTHAWRWVFQIRRNIS